MQKIDSHQHFWIYNKVRDAWINDDMQNIQRNFLPQDLLPVLHENNIDGCIAVQADQSVEETNFLLKLADENDMNGLKKMQDKLSGGRKVKTEKKPAAKKSTKK